MTAPAGFERLVMTPDEEQQTWSRRILRQHVRRERYSMIGQVPHPTQQTTSGKIRDTQMRTVASKGISLEKNTALEESFRISRMVLNNVSLNLTLAKPDSIMSYGVGMMMARMVEQDMLTDELEAMRVLRREFLPRGRYDTLQLKFNRVNVIDCLKRNNLVKPSVNLRNIKPSGTHPTQARILEIVSRKTGITVDEMTSSSRNIKIVAARFMAMWIMRTVCGISLSVIGDALGGRDHTSVINGINQIEKRAFIEDAKRQMINDLTHEADMNGIRNGIEMSNIGIKSRARAGNAKADLVRKQIMKAVG